MPAPKKQPKQVFMLAKGLTNEEAYRQAKRKAKHDFRGFSYNPKTGRAALI